jgi:hypothetical protein
VTPWLIITTGWPTFAFEIMARIATAPVTVTLAATGAALLISVAVVRLRARGHPSRRSAS